MSKPANFSVKVVFFPMEAGFFQVIYKKNSPLKTAEHLLELEGIDVSVTLRARGHIDSVEISGTI
jgi:hypothetical protein